MEKQTPSYYSVLTADVRYSDKLTNFEKILYSEITALSNINGYSNASNSYFAKLYGFNAVSISRNIMHLKKYGFLKVTIIRNENKQITSRKLYPLTQGGINPKVNTPINPKVNTPINPNVNPPINHTVKGNTTSINTTSNNKSQKSSGKIYDTSNDNFKVANYLWEQIQKNNPEAKEPNLQNWANTVRLMHERDKRDYEKIKKMIDWCQTNDFWSTVVLSANKLRKQYDQMNAQAGRELNGSRQHKQKLNYEAIF
ncbi:helix-turn-helix domain-containing protein [Companilactobacillus mishanensis]|uniref:Helix-turn-helix domain-containing protein n=1 Tax=Companilactobacillus mishanensis TaxID=2486008 RepID=A0A5P0ZF02_9LACO|nr:helix-turn-helix domain-containing protein [Companilactobacillus mishanensis]MQS44271.1 helix-turn-helix domain-containing protein [Companilactobacillus mishanensis]MQS51626.1 helix-turn-helix domain-containing protein [Companilactobacillus mishanensis]